MWRREHLIIGLSGLVLAACSVPAPELAPERPDQPWHPAATPSGEMLPGRAAPAASSVSAADYRLPANRAAAALPGGPALDAQHAYTLPELIDIAESANPDTRIAWAAARSAAEATGIARSAYLPHVAADVVGLYQASRGRNGVQGYELPGRDSATGSVSALSLQWLLFDFGARDARMEEARQLSLVSNIAYTGAHQRVMYEVCMAYYAYTAARARTLAARDVLENAQAVEAAAQARYAQGIGTVVEVAQTRQAGAQARLLLVQAEGSASDSYLALLTALGVSPLSTLQVAVLPERQLDEDTQLTAERIVEEALERRPDVLAAYTAQKASAARIDASQAEFKPKVFLSATGSYTSGRIGITSFPPFGQQPPTLNLAGSQWGGTVLFGMTIPLFDGGLRDSVLRQARADADKAAATLDRVKTQVAREVVSAQNRLRTSLAALGASTALEEAAHTTLDAAQDAYRHGLGSVTDATVAQTLWLQARNARTDAYSAVLAAAATLAFATGNVGSLPGLP